MGTVVNWYSLKDNIETRVRKLFCKRPDNKHFVLYGYIVSVSDTQSVIVAWKHSQVKYKQMTVAIFQ